MFEEIFGRNIKHQDVLLQTMGSITVITLIVITTVEFIFGNVGNGVIALVISIDWAKRGTISSIDQILTALAISRIVLLWLMFIHLFVFVSNQGFLVSGKGIRMFNNSCIVTSHFSIWLATCLSIFYFLKIANFSNSIFLYLKWRVKKVVSVILLVSLIPLLCNLVLVNIHMDAWVDTYKRNTTSLNNSARYFKLLLLINTMFTLIPFTMSLITFLLLIFSLCRHLRIMQHDAQGPRDASTKAHITALQSVIAFLLLYAIFILSYLIPVFISDLVNKNVLLMFFQATGIAFPSGHSGVLILGNNKLRQASLSVLWWLRHKFRQ
ncbi:taste receptor type 2 member 140-like [Tupaia chinensis]|uniref:taste receptor type 2 member 140-like n=1 Tax=Tupaia chinensis TaxID=246437 RepID=UPI0003C8F8A8|nr:taste receptor type 2 member 140-like [Tupaia chinensis]